MNNNFLAFITFRTKKAKDLFRLIGISPGDHGAVVRQDFVCLRIDCVKVDIRRPRIDPAARSVDKRIHGRKDLIDLYDET
jgi:hypothetical protein